MRTAIPDVVSNTSVDAPVSRIPLAWMMPTGTDPAVSALLPPLPARASDVTRAAGRQAGHGGQKISCAPEWAVTLVIATPPPMIAPLRVALSNRTLRRGAKNIPFATTPGSLIVTVVPVPRTLKMTFRSVRPPERLM